MELNDHNNSVLSSVRYYLKYGYIREFRAWKWIVEYYLVVAILAVLFLSLLIYSFQVFPPKNTTIAAGQLGSSTQKMATSFQKYFAEQGLVLNVVSGEGQGEGLTKLVTESSPVNVGFYIAGHIKPEDYPNLVSLGSVHTAPLWLFYRGAPIKTDNLFQSFRGKKIAIGLPGTAANSMFRRLSEGQGSDGANGVILQELPYDVAEKRLKSGEIDAMFMVYSYDTQIVQDLIKNPDVHILSFPLADAYTKKFPNLEKVTIPRGAFDIENVFPREDVTMLSTTVNLLSDKSLHHSIQWALLMGARQYNRHEKHFFSRPGEFPKDLDYDAIPLSPVAERYYSGGIPQVFSSLPLWLASLVDQVWIRALAFFIFIYPLALKLFNLRSFASEKIKNDSFGYLRYLKIEGLRSNSPLELEIIIKRLDELMNKVLTLWGSDNDAKDYIELVLLARQAKADLEEKLQGLR